MTDEGKVNKADIGDARLGIFCEKKLNRKKMNNQDTE